MKLLERLVFFFLREYIFFLLAIEDHSEWCEEL